jgi:hypothetical protein
VRLAAPTFTHLLRISGPLGTFEHAEFDQPRLEHGLCADDVSRVLVVLLREVELSDELATLEATSFSYLAQSLDRHGRCRNRRSMTGTWTGPHTRDDCWGRTIRALGATVADGRDPMMRSGAAELFVRAVSGRSRYVRPMAFAALGAASILRATPDDVVAQAFARDAIHMLNKPEVSDEWRWIEPRLTYANATLAGALIAAGGALGDAEAVRSGTRKLAWLLESETRDGHLSVTPAGGRGPKDLKPGFDQQPIEVAAIAEACAIAADVTGEATWLEGVELAANWYHGRNDLGVVMFDAVTGAGFDGLTATGPNVNQGAESTVAVLETLQLARRCARMSL